MQNKRHFTDEMIAFVSALMATLFLIACQQSQQPAATSTPTETKPATSDLFVTFEGPWAIVPDPKDGNSVLAIAPKTKSHRFLAFVPGNTELDAGVYDLTIPARPGSEAPTYDKGVLRVKVDPQVIQRALDRRTERYAIRLPKPEAYVAETRYVSRVGPTYPPDASTEQDFVTAISLRYSATSKTGIQLAGTPDEGGAFKPLLMEATVPALRFTIDPVEVHLHDETCHAHARQAFHDVVTLIGVALYVDFPPSESPADCHKTDPQVPHSPKAQLPQSFGNALSARLLNDFGPLQMADMTPRILAPYLDLGAKKVGRGIEAAFYFFHGEGGGCVVPIPVGG